jgi:thioesterase domain-containing protein
MRPEPSLVIVLPGAGNMVPDLTMFAAPGDTICFKTIDYPGWQRFVERGFSIEVLVSELASQIAAMVPRGPIRILGFSLGGHFGYAAALALQARGREISGFCAIDSFIIPPTAQRTPVRNSYRVLRDGRFGDFLRRAMIRSTGDRLPSLLRGFAPSGRLSASFAEEVRMQLLIRQAEPWIRSLDIEPVALKAPAILFRTPESAGDDGAWHQRCPGVEIFEIPGDHRTISEVLEKSRNLKTTFAPKIIGTIRESFLNAMRG